MYFKLDRNLITNIFKHTNLIRSDISCQFVHQCAFPKDNRIVKCTYKLTINLKV